MYKLKRFALTIALILTAFSLGACTLQNKTSGHSDTYINEVNYSNELDETERTNLNENKINYTGEVVLTITIEASYKAKPTPEFLYEKADLVVVAIFSEDIRSVCDQWGRPQTTAKFTILEVLKGDAVPNTTVSALYTGGRVTLAEYMKTQSSEALERYGWVNISEAEAKNLYVEYVNTDAPMPHFKNDGQRYMLFLRFLPSEANADYVISESGWAALEINEMNAVYSHFSKHYEEVSFYAIKNKEDYLAENENRP